MRRPFFRRPSPVGAGFLTGSLVVLLLAGLFLFGLGPSEMELGEGYYYLPEYEAIDVGYSGGATVYQSYARNYFDNVLVEGGIVQVQKDTRFILVAQKTPGTPRTAHSGAGAAATAGLGFYIIVKSSATVYGPLDKDAYARKRKALGVPEGLELAEK